MRASDTLVPAGQGYRDLVDAPAANVIGHGQMGYTTDLSNYISNAAYIKRPLIPIVIDVPRGFRDLPDPNVWTSTFKSLMEEGSQTITGLNATITAEYTSNAIGPAGEMQEDIAKQTRQRSVPVHTFVEKYGKPINSFFEGWIRYLIGDVDNNGVPAVRNLDGIEGPTDLLPDYTSATVLYIEPDPLHKYVIRAWLITNMMPKSGGVVEGSRDITAAGTLTEYSIEFTGIQMVNAGVKQAAQTILDRINLTGANPHRRQAFLSEVQADVEAADGGYEETVNKLVDEQI